MHEKIKVFYEKGYWTEVQVSHAVAKGVISVRQAGEILKGGTDAEM
ncbi:MAG: XkdX family protein [Oscillospiraceae bacterium]|nr:XkdX family protein [Oscillospiraceae bacterium]